MRDPFENRSAGRLEDVGLRRLPAKAGLEQVEVENLVRLSDVLRAHPAATALIEGNDDDRGNTRTVVYAKVSPRSPLHYGLFERHHAFSCTMPHQNIQSVPVSTSYLRTRSRRPSAAMRNTVSAAGTCWTESPSRTSSGSTAAATSMRSSRWIQDVRGLA